MAARVEDIDDYRPHLVILTPGQVHVVPVSLVEDLAGGRRAFQDVDDWEPMVRTIIREWLDMVKGE